MTAVFNPDSVYGNRNGSHPMLLILPNDKSNVFLQSKMWKVGVVNNIEMLPRADFVKLDKESLGGAGPMTRAQEFKQALLSMTCIVLSLGCG